MTGEEQQRFEAELGRIKPAPVPEDFAEQLRRSRISTRSLNQKTPRQDPGVAYWFVALRWLVAAAPVIVAAIFFFRFESRREAGKRQGLATAAKPAAMKADAVEFDHDLVTTFDAVAELPNGEAVRFRCRQWVDGVVVSNDARGVVIGRSRPRVEVVPVRFETY